MSSPDAGAASVTPGRQPQPAPDPSSSLFSVAATAAAEAASATAAASSHFASTHSENPQSPGEHSSALAAAAAATAAANAIAAPRAFSPSHADAHVDEGAMAAALDSGTRERRRAVVWNHFTHARTLGDDADDHSYTCIYCGSSLKRSGRDIGAPALVTHALTCVKCPAVVKVEIAADSKGKKAKTFLAARGVEVRLEEDEVPVGAVQKQRSVVWGHYEHTRSFGGEGGARREDHSYRCKYCRAELKRNGRDIGAPALITHSLTCGKCPPGIKLEIAKASQGKKARTFLSAQRGGPVRAKVEPVSTPTRAPLPLLLEEAPSVAEVRPASSSMLAAVAAPVAMPVRGTTSMLVAAGRVSEEERLELDVLLASFVIGERLSVSSVESPFLRAFIEKIGPAYARASDGATLIPSQTRLACSLLEKVYSSVKRIVDDTEVASCGMLSLAFDATALTHRNSLNVLGNLPEGMDIFRECIWTGDDVVTPEYMAAIMTRHIDSVGVDKVCAVASDNSPSILQARSIVCEKFPTIINVGDEPHCVDLLVEDLTKIVPEFSSALTKSKAIIAFIKGHPEVDALHQRACTALKCPAKLEFHPDKHYAYFDETLMQLIATEPALQAMVSNDFSQAWASAVENTQEETDSRIFHIIRNQQTWEEFRSVCAYAKPLRTLICALESKTIRFSDVLVSLTMAYDTLQRLLDDRCVTPGSHEQIIVQCRKRLFGFNSGSLVVLLRPEHVSAAVLDPLFRPPDLSQEHLGATATVIDKFYRDEPEKRTLARQQLSSYALKEDGFSPIPSAGLIWEPATENAKLDPAASMKLRSETRRTNSIQWWKLFGGSAPELQKLAIALASTSAQAVSASRSFDIKKLAQNKQQAAPGASTVDMLQYCYFNLRSLKNLPPVKRGEESAIDDMTMEFLLASAEGEDTIMT